MKTFAELNKQLTEAAIVRGDRDKGMPTGADRADDTKPLMVWITELEKELKKLRTSYDDADANVAIWLYNRGRTAKQTAKILASKIDESLDEVNASRYTRVHGKTPRGSGTWFFTTHPGGVDFDKHKEGVDYVKVSDNYGVAAKKAEKMLKSKKLFVGESVELDEALDLKAFIEKIKKKLKLRDFDKEERKRKKEIKILNKRYSKNILGLSEFNEFAKLDEALTLSSDDLNAVKKTAEKLAKQSPDLTYYVVKHKVRHFKGKVIPYFEVYQSEDWHIAREHGAKKVAGYGANVNMKESVEQIDEFATARIAVDKEFRKVTRSGKMDTLAATRHVEKKFGIKNVKVQKDKNGKVHVISFDESVRINAKGDEVNEVMSDREMEMFTKAHTALHTRYHKQALQIIKFIDSVEKHKDKWVDSFGDYITPKLPKGLKLSNPNSVEYQQGRGRGNWSFLMGHDKVRYNNSDMPWMPKSGELPFDKFMKLLGTWKKNANKPKSTGSHMGRQTESVELDESKMSELHMHIKDGKTAEQIAKIMKIDLHTVKVLMKESVELDEKFTIVGYDKKGKELSGGGHTALGMRDAESAAKSLMNNFGAVKVEIKERGKVVKTLSEARRGGPGVIAPLPKATGFAIRIPIKDKKHGISLAKVVGSETGKNGLVDSGQKEGDTYLFKFKNAQQRTKFRDKYLRPGKLDEAEMKDDILVVLDAIEKLGKKATVNNIVKSTKMNKTFVLHAIEFWMDDKKVAKKGSIYSVTEDAPASSTSGVSGLTPSTVGGDARLMKMNRRKKKMKTDVTEDAVHIELRDNYCGHPVFHVSEDDFARCKVKRRKGERWNKYFGEDSEIGSSIKKYSLKNPNKPIVIQNETTGEMVLFRRRHNDQRLRHNRILRSQQ